MAQAAVRPCRKPGCPEYRAPGGRGYCGQHKRHGQKRYDKRRGTAASRGYDRTWRKARDRYINQHPMCEHCHTAPAEEVDHIVPLPEGPRLDPRNLQALCKPCHGRKTAAEA